MRERAHTWGAPGWPGRCRWRSRIRKLQIFWRGGAPLPSWLQCLFAVCSASQHWLKEGSTKRLKREWKNLKREVEVKLKLLLEGFWGSTKLQLKGKWEIFLIPCVVLSQSTKIPTKQSPSTQIGDFLKSSPPPSPFLHVLGSARIRINSKFCGILQPWEQREQQSCFKKLLLAQEIHTGGVTGAAAATKLSQTVPQQLFCPWWENNKK